MSPLTDPLLHDGYSFWLLLVGAPLTADRRASVSYNLARSAREYHLLDAGFREKIYPSRDRHQTVGVYQTQPTMLAESLQFGGESAWPLLIISKRKDFAAGSNLDRLYGAASEGISPLSLAALDWKKVAIEACSQRDIVVNSWIEDLTRSVTIVVSTETLANLNCFPLIDAK